MADAEEKFGGELGEILWVDVRPGENASIISVEYLSEDEIVEETAEYPVEDPVDDQVEDPVDDAADASADEPANDEENESESTEVSKGSPNTGVEGIAVVAGLAALAGAAVTISRKTS